MITDLPYHRAKLLCLILCVTESLSAQTDSIRVSGSPRQWHKITWSIAGPQADERDQQPNPFTDYRLSIQLTHQSGTPRYDIPGYFAADGNAAESSATAGHIWRVHFAPDQVGRWDYRVSFVTGPQVAVDDTAAATPVEGLDGQTGSLVVAASDKAGRDLRACGRLQYVGQRYLRFAGSGDYFLKAGPDAPETLLAYADFDGTEARSAQAPLKTWQPHLRDWRAGDPGWQRGKGRGLIGALNYLADKGLNTVSFLPYNAGGDGDNVWPFVAREQKLHYDCSKLDQWGIVFDHATHVGLHLHFKLQENEIDDNRRGHERKVVGDVPESLDQGGLGPERKLYCRELVARFAHALALNWNLGEENTQSSEEIRQMAQYLRDIDPYDHPIVIHTFPDEQDRVYTPLLGDQSVLTGASLQNPWNRAHQRTLQWVRASAAAGRPWVVANDEQNPAPLGVPPDPGYQGQDGVARQRDQSYSLHDIRRLCLWGTLMAGGAGVEYYFGYEFPQNDLNCEDFRSRDQSWDYCRIALNAWRDLRIPFWQMENADELIGNAQHGNSRYCFAQPNQVYLVYLPTGGSSELDLSQATGEFTVQWFNPRQGGPPQSGRVQQVSGGGTRPLGDPPSDPDQDWLVIVRAK